MKISYGRPLLDRLIEENSRTPISTVTLSELDFGKIAEDIKKRDFAHTTGDTWIGVTNFGFSIHMSEFEDDVED